MDYNIKINKKYIGIPVAVEKPLEMLEIFSENSKLYEFQVPVDLENSSIDYYSYLNMEKYRGQTLTFRGKLGAVFFDSLIQTDKAEQPALVRPLIHLTAERGWINDPNGLVWKDGVFQLFFQHNPMDIQWQNMSWGHAVSRDLLRFEWMDDALYPDEYGTAYSGCGLVNEHGLLALPKDALLFFYTAAGKKNSWSKDEPFTQRIAYSLDAGKTLTRLPVPAVGEMEEETRDPKIFWHEETKAYIMVLFVNGNEFAILRSSDLREWQVTDTIVLPPAWECPDLFCLEGQDGPRWIFTSADGFYYFGTFDGYHFATDGVQRNMYLTKLPYAAQTYSGISDRIIIVSWLRTLNKGKQYRGAMALPRELGLVQTSEGESLSILPVREYEREKQEVCDFTWNQQEFRAEFNQDAVYEIALILDSEEPVTVELFGQKVIIEKDALTFREERTALLEAYREVHLFIDRQILEIYGNQGTLNAYYETGSDALQGDIRISGGSGKGKIYTWIP